MTESSLDPDRLGPTADPLSSLDPATARIAAMDAALPSWHLGPFWAAVALLALVLMLAVMVWPLRGRIANSRVLRQFSAVRRVSSDPSIVRQPHLLPSLSAQSARDHPLCLPRSLHPAHIDSNAHTRVRVHTTTTATRTHTHTASLSLVLCRSLPRTHSTLSRARAHFKPWLASCRPMRVLAQAHAALDIEDTPCIGTSMSPGLAPTPGAAPTPDVNPGYSTFRLDVEEQTVLQQWRDAREEWKKSIATAARGLRT